MMRSGSLQARKGLLRHRDIEATLIYAHLDPAHLRTEVARTAWRAPAAATEKRPPAAVSTKSAQSASATVESGERVR
jgi:hypothetical protein